MEGQKKHAFFRFLMISIGIKILILFGFFLYLSGKGLPQSSQQNLSGSVQMCFEEQCFTLEVARSPLERRLGLAGREKLDEKCGMLFVFDEPGKYNFFMQDTLIPLDILWIDAEGKVLQIVEAETCETRDCPTYQGPEAGFRVVELNRGMSKKIGLHTGDFIRLYE